MVNNMPAIYISGSTQEKNIGALNYGTEETRMQFLSDLVKKYLILGKTQFTIYRNNGSMTLSQSIADSNSKKVDVHLALHSNAGGGDGTEAYYHDNSEKGKKLATLIYNAVSPLTLSRDNGVMSDKVLYNSGLAELRETTSPAALIEIMFHDNKSDVIDYLCKIDIIAKSLAISIYKYFGIDYNDVNQNNSVISGINIMANNKVITNKSRWSQKASLDNEIKQLFINASIYL
jgi:N-acetylmuramoyl-L-alanine amidase